MYYIRALIYDFLFGFLKLRICIGGVAKCVLDVEKVHACTLQKRVINENNKAG